MKKLPPELLTTPSSQKLFSLIAKNRTWNYIFEAFIDSLKAKKVMVLEWFSFPGPLFYKLKRSPKQQTNEKAELNTNDSNFTTNVYILNSI